jgi:hypothetical protein
MSAGAPIVLSAIKRQLRSAFPKAMEGMQVTRSIKYLPILLCAFLMGPPEGMASTPDWTVVTLAQDGSWGVASNGRQPQAIADAIKACRAMAGSSSDCGAQLTAVRGDWVIANLCGDHKVLATGSSLTDAEQQALYREISLQLHYVPDLPPCKRMVTVDPSGAIVRTNLQLSTAR